MTIEDDLSRSAGLVARDDHQPIGVVVLNEPSGAIRKVVIAADPGPLHRWWPQASVEHTDVVRQNVTGADDEQFVGLRHRGVI